MSTLYIRYPLLSGGPIPPSSFPLLAPDGSAAAPSYSFSNDPDTGMFLAGTNNLGFSAGGTKVVDILTAGLTVTGVATANSFIPTGSTVPTNGMYLPSANQVGIAASSTSVLRFSYSSGSVITGLNSTSTDGFFINNGNSDSLMSLSADTGSGSGRNMRFHGNSHATLANVFQLRNATTVDFSVNASGLCTLGASGGTQTHAINGRFEATLRASVDGTGSSSYSFRTGQATTLSGTTQGGILVSNAVTSAATTFAAGFASQVTTAAASFTVPVLNHFFSDNLALGSGSSVTRYVSYFATTPTRGTNNASIADNTSWTGNRFISQTGTAQSDFGGLVNCSTNGIRTKVSTANTANPPTDAELDSAFGTPATVGTGFIGLLNDNNGGTNEYLCWSDGTNWFYATGTKAV